VNHAIKQRGRPFSGCAVSLKMVWAPSIPEFMPQNAGIRRLHVLNRIRIR
jgi:hypothetical protein